MIPHRPIYGRERALPFDARLITPLRRGDAKAALAFVLLHVAPVLGAGVALAVWLAKHLGVLSDAQAVTPESTPWGAPLVLAAVLWLGVALAASVMRGVR